MDLEDNNIEDQIYHFDEEKDESQRNAEPWKSDPHYFTHVKISAVALLKMVIHARTGIATEEGDLEVMGNLEGKIDGHTLIVMDTFALPIRATSIRANATNESYEYMVSYHSSLQEIGKKENLIGWYHSHPGYGCWLSGIDVNTQMGNQQHMDPWLAIVVDPKRTMSSGKVDIGAFRCYPAGYTPPDAVKSEYQSIPLDKIEDFGVHCNQYYELEVSVFKSSLDNKLFDLLWNKYWVNTLSSSPLLSDRSFTTGRISDLATKLEKAENKLQHSRGMGNFFMPSNKKGNEESQLSKVTKDASRSTGEQVQAIMSQVIKDHLFN
eukprot:TRINITY_DN6450_c0_g1_i1.p1 TRINITY_DN6450_c0_g1~~TRINITY_DN6450_c0_g1_i1.p1  ORF type:complete len:322 (+),score=78.70 TRINITY_DN6450_c0_g1_i1:33-998(+)